MSNRWLLLLALVMLPACAARTIPPPPPPGFAQEPPPPPPPQEFAPPPPPPAAGPPPPAQVAIQACKPDIGRFCGSVEPGNGRIKACMKQHLPELSEPCKEALFRAWLDD